MKLKLFVAASLLSVTALAETKSYQGISSATGKACAIRFDVAQDGKSISGLVMDADFVINNKLDSEVKTERMVEQNYAAEKFVFGRGSKGTITSKLTLRESGFRNKVTLQFAGNSLNDISSVKFSSDVGVLLYTIGKLEMTCENLKAL